MENYEKYILECEEREKMEHELQDGDAKVDPEQAEKWKERRECLKMLKRELGKVRDGVDTTHDLEYLLESEENKEKGASITEIQDDGISEDGHVDKVNTNTSMSKQEVNTENKKEK